MAIDTADKRAATIQVAQPWIFVYPTPDAGAEGQADRQHMAWTYPGILAGVQSQPAVLEDLTTVFVWYCEDLRDANPTDVDTNTLIRDDRPTVIAAKGQYVDDANTMYQAYLS